MRGCNFQKAQFVTSAAKFSQCPKTDLPEIAVVGRSNVGKSSLLNSLFGTKKLVKTSAAPGKTRLLNFFSVDDCLMLADLPGYGYAKVSKAELAKWGPMVRSYLEGRENLVALLLLIDIRRTPNEEDLLLLDWASAASLPLEVVITKADKLSSSKRKPRVREILEVLGREEAILYSVTKKIGRESLIECLEAYVEKD